MAGAHERLVVTVSVDDRRDQARNLAAMVEGVEGHLSSRGPRGDLGYPR